MVRHNWLTAPRLLAAGLWLAGAAACAAQPVKPVKPPPPPLPEVKTGLERDKAVREMLGSPARMAWIRDGKTLVCLDTEDGKGDVERSFEGFTRIDRPLITPTGRQVIFISFEKWASFIVNWDGTGLKQLVEGRATSVRMDEKGTEWVYWQNKQNEILTAPLTDLARSQRVTKIRAAPRDGKTENFQTSADGTRAASNYPHPQVGFAKIPQNEDENFVNIGTGCWPQIARDNSYRVIHCTDGSHSRISLFNAATNKRVVIPFGPGAAFRRGGGECPRWAADPRFLICTDRPGRQTNVYIGKFNPEFTQLGDWLVVSNKGANGEAEIWIAAFAKYPGAAAPAATAVAPVAPPRNKWPASHVGLQFLWEDLTSLNQILTPEGKQSTRCLGVLHGAARPGRYRSADLGGGYLLAETGGRNFMQGCLQSNQFTLEATVTPANLTQDGPAALLSFGSGPEGANVLLGQARDKLVLKVRTQGADGKPTDQTAVLVSLREGQAQHLAVTYAAGRTSVYLNGEPAGGSDAIKGALTGWKDYPLAFGDVPGGGRNWAGCVEGLALYSRALSAAEVAQEYAAYAPKLAKRDNGTRFVVTGRLTETSDIPSLQAIQPYSRSMVPYAYVVEKVEPARPDGPVVGKAIQVAHWVYLDSKRIPQNKKVGQSCVLTVERSSDWPGMEQERLDGHLEDASLPLFLDVGR